MIAPDVHFADRADRAANRISAVLSASSLAQVCTLICVATLASRAARCYGAHSCSVWVRGLAE